jgi:hypothetical protein
VRVDEGADGGLGLGDAAMDAAPDLLGRQLGEPSTRFNQEPYVGVK